jgi:BirA family biotin operon repressor/biotin-[acetyl-CoA-carboxylase] ligase
LAEPRFLTFVHFDEVSSTNDVAFTEGRARVDELGRLGGVPALLVRAGRQIAGRGRAGHIWESPVGAGLYLSIYLRPSWTPRQAVWLTLAAGLAVRTACAKLTRGVAPDLKWPNDLLMPDGSGRKLGGILVETRTQGQRIEEAVVGIGVNVREPEGGWPPSIASIAGNLMELVPEGSDLPLDVVQLRTIVELDRELTALASDPDAAVRSLLDRARAASSLWGRLVRFEQAGELVTGVARTWADDGGLEVELGDGSRVVVHAGDVAVTWDRPQGGAS